MAIVRAYVEERRAVGQIARTSGISRQLVRAVLDRHAIPRDPARRTPRVTVDEPALIRAYRDQHRTLAECAVTFAVSITAVTRVLDRHHIPHGRRPAPIPASTEDAVIRAYRDERKSLAACARDCHIPQAAVIAILNRHGVPIRRQLPDAGAVITALRRDGLSNTDAAARLGTSAQTVARIKARQPPSRADAITPGEAARILGTSIGILHRHATAWRLTVLRTSGGQRRYRRGEIQDLATSPALSPRPGRRPVRSGSPPVTDALTAGTESLAPPSSPPRQAAPAVPAVKGLPVSGGPG